MDLGLSYAECWEVSPRAIITLQRFMVKGKQKQQRQKPGKPGKGYRPQRDSAPQRLSYLPHP